MHQGNRPFLVLVDQMGMGLCPRQFWEGIVCVPMEVANRPCPGTHSLQGVQVEGKDRSPASPTSVLPLSLGYESLNGGAPCECME